MITSKPGTKLEYSTSPGRRGNGSLAFVRPALTGGSETRGTWRQPHASLTLGPAGTPEDAVRYGVRFRWAMSYDEMRAILFEEGLFEVRVVPGMTVPDDLDAQFSLHTKARIEDVRAEFPAETAITSLGEPRPDHHLYRVRFSRLGENRLTIVHDGGRETHLEFFVTEPLETLIKKRAHFIATRQQHRDPARWYDALFSVYDMRAKVLRSPDDTDGCDYWWGYVVAADDPVLGKAPFLASKNLRFPDAHEIGAIESSYALAKYGATHDMAPDMNLRFDRNKKPWYSHPSVTHADSRAFMDRQLLAGLAVRGWLEPGYYLFGSDFTGPSDAGALSYMANMGGWGILDYALRFAPSPWDWLQLGYASYLSSWALMNTGPPGRELRLR